MKLRALKEEANQLITKGKFEKAADKLWDAITLDPADAQLRLRHAECCRRVGQKGKALVSLREASELLSSQGHFARAQAALKVAMELFPGHPSLQREMRKLEEQRLMAGVSNTGVISGAISGVFGGYAGAVTGSQAAHTRGIDFGEPPKVMPTSPVELPVAEDEEEELLLEDMVESPVVLGVLEEEAVPAISPVYPMIRRLSDKALAIRPSADAKWIVVHAQSAIRVKFVEQLSEAAPVRTFSGELLSEAVMARIRDSKN